MDGMRRQEPPRWMRAAGAALDAAGLALAPLTGGWSAAASAAGKAAAKRAAIRAAGEAARSPEARDALLAAALAALGLLLALALALGMVPAAFVAGQPEAGGFVSGEPTELALGEIPADLLPVFLAAQEDYGISWAVLAAVAKVESGFGKGETYLKRNGVSPVGAVGFMQFMPSTWSGSGNPMARDDPAAPSWDTDPARIASYGGYGVDGDGDGDADPFDPRDAVPAAAKYLAANGFASDPAKTLYRYNRDWGYVARVLELAAAYARTVMPVGRGVWPLPAEFREVTSGFGWRLHPVLKVPDFHDGIDVAAPAGTPVLAAADGVVVHAGRLGGYGPSVKVRHADGSVTLYAHLSEILVPPGKRVAAGEPVGRVGSEGLSTGPHLHFSVYVAGRPVDPEEWLTAPAAGGGLE